MTFDQELLRWLGDDLARLHVATDAAAVVSIVDAARKRTAYLPAANGVLSPDAGGRPAD